MAAQFTSLVALADALATSLINEGAGHHPLLDLGMKWLALGGVPAIIFTVVAQWWNTNERSRRRHAVLSSGFAFLLSLGINQIVLLVVERTRPYDAIASHLIIPPSADPSFPSDHASAAFAVAFSFLLLGWRRKGMWYAVAAALLALSRVYVGIHYLGDVVGGATTAYLAASFVYLAFRQESQLNQRLSSIL